MADRLFTDPALREAYRALMRDHAGSHLDPATWDRIVAGEINPAERDAAFDHVVTCEHCSHIWRGVLALKAEAESQGLIARETPAGSWLASRSLGGGWRSRVVPLAAAAALVAAIGSVMLMRPRPPAEEAIRSATEVAAVDGLMMAYAADGVPTLVWTPLPEATRYRVEVFTDEGRPVWERAAASPPLGWPDDAPRVKGAYRWRVDALNGDTLLARSRLTPMELVR